MTEQFELLEEEIIRLLEEKSYTQLRELLAEMNPVDIGIIMSDLEERKIPILFRLLPKELAAETFVEMDVDAQELLIQGFSDNELKEIINEMYDDDAADLVEEMPANVVKRILKQANPEMRAAINQILRYPENKTTHTQRAFEPDHFRFVGQKHATRMRELEMSLEEYANYMKLQAYS